jgi:hypothetical protein
MFGILLYAFHFLSGSLLNPEIEVDAAAGAQEFKESGERERRGLVRAR